MTRPFQNTQVAPFPHELADLVATMSYRPGWEFKLVPNLDRGQGSEGLTLIVTSIGYNTYSPQNGESYRVQHYMIPPPAAFDRKAWTRWLLEQLLLIEQHETCEFFQIDGNRPFAPNHGPGRDPYVILELGTLEDAETSFRGVRDQDSQAVGG
jgi:hypothetical protein